MEEMEYRCVVIQAKSSEVLAYSDADRFRLPRVQIPAATGPAQQVQRAMKAIWKLDVFVLGVWTATNRPGPCAVAELLAQETLVSPGLIPIEQLCDLELTEEECHRIRELLECRTKFPCSRPGWIGEAISWIESATGRSFGKSRTIEQWNAGGGFMLLRVHADTGQQYWLKAVGEPNTHEFAIMRFLWTVCPDCLPDIVAMREPWNSWITENAGDPISDAPDYAELENAARCMSQLHVLTAGRTDELMALGAYDHRVPALRSRIDKVIAFLIEAMARQSSTKVAPLSRDRLLELGRLLHEACSSLEALKVPDTLIHNDLNAGNILSDGSKCVITDWSEAAGGNPFLSCARLSQLNRAHEDRIQNVYKNCWKHLLSPECLERAIALTRLLAIYAYLYGRGNWMSRKDNVRPAFESYARSLARHMDRVAKDSFFLEAICR